MSKDLKNLIDSVEDQETEKSDYEQIIENLKEKINKLNFSLNEQKLLIKEQEKELNKREDLDVPEELQILKDMVIAQRQDLKKKDKDIEILEERVDGLLAQLDNSAKFGDEMTNNEELIKAKKLVVQLTEENETLKQNENSAKELIEHLEKEKETYRLENKNLKNQLLTFESEAFEKGLGEINSEELESESEEEIMHSDQFDEITEKLLTIEEENNKLKKDLDTANITIDNLVAEINSKMKEISDQEKEIREKSIKLSALDEKYESAKRQNMELQKELEEFSEDTGLSKDKLEYYELELQESEKAINNLKDENIRLNKLVSELNENKLFPDKKLETQIPYDKEFEEMIDYLKKENQQLKKSIIELREKESSSFVELETSESSYEDIIDTNKNLKAENERLNNLILDLKKIKIATSNDKIYNISVDQFAPKFYQNLLFVRLFNNLDKYRRDLLIDSLIQDLINSKSLDIKRYIIDILSEIKDERRIRDTLIDMIINEDWLIRLHLVKALSKFDAEDTRDALEELLNDADLDVREAAKKALKRI
ncbi:MAG: HEAT repeat domain-containing protein [Candidatus Thorarchaeota archaeon]